MIAPVLLGNTGLMIEPIYNDKKQRNKKLDSNSMEWKSTSFNYSNILKSVSVEKNLPPINNISPKYLYERERFKNKPVDFLDEESKKQIKEDIKRSKFKNGIYRSIKVQNNLFLMDVESILEKSLNEDKNDMGSSDIRKVKFIRNMIPYKKVASKYIVFNKGNIQKIMADSEMDLLVG